MAEQQDNSEVKMIRRLVDLVFQTQGADAARKEIDRLHQSYGSATAGVGGWEKAQKSANRAVLESVPVLGKLEKAIHNTSRGTKQFITELSSIKALMAGFGLGKAVHEATDYNKAILALNNSFMRFGKSVGETESTVINLGKKLTLTRAETTKLIDAYQKGIPVATFEGASKMLTNIHKITGANTEAMQKYLGVLTQIASQYPEMQTAVENLTESDREMLKAKADLLVIQGKMSLAESKSLKEIAAAKDNMSKKDKDEREARERQAEALQKIKAQWESVAITLGQTLLPFVKTFADFLERNKGTVETLAKLFGTIGVPLLAANVAVKGMAASWGGVKGIIGGVVGLFGKGTAAADKMGAAAGEAAATSGKGGLAARLKSGAASLMGKVTGAGAKAGEGQQCVKMCDAGAGGGAADSIKDMIGDKLGDKIGSKLGDKLKDKLGGKMSARWTERMAGRGSSWGRMGRNMKAMNLRMGRGYAGILSKAHSITGFKSLAGFAGAGGAKSAAGLLAKGAKFTPWGLAAMAGEVGLDYAANKLEAKGHKKTAGAARVGSGLMGVGGMALTGAAIGSAVPVIGTAVGAVVGGVVGFAMNFKKIAKGFSQMFPGLAKGLKSAWTGFKKVAGGIFSKIGGLFSKIGKGLWSGVKAVGGFIGKGIGKLWGGLKKFGSWFAGTKIGGALVSLGKKALGLVKKFSLLGLAMSAFKFFKKKGEEEEERKKKLGEEAGKAAVQQAQKEAKDKAGLEDAMMSGKDISQYTKKIKDAKEGEAALEARIAKENPELSKDKIDAMKLEAEQRLKNIDIKRQEMASNDQEFAKLSEEEQRKKAAEALGEGEVENLEQVKQLNEKIAEIEKQRNEKYKTDLDAQKKLQSEAAKIQEQVIALIARQQQYMNAIVGLKDAELAKADALLESNFAMGKLGEGRVKFEEQMNKATEANAEAQKQIQTTIRNQEQAREVYANARIKSLEDEAKKQGLVGEAATKWAKERLKYDTQMVEFDTQKIMNETKLNKLQAEGVKLALDKLKAIELEVALRQRLFQANANLTQAMVENQKTFGVSGAGRGQIVAQRQMAKSALAATVETQTRFILDAKKQIADLEAKGIKDGPVYVELQEKILNAQTEIANAKQKALQVDLQDLQVAQALAQAQGNLSQSIAAQMSGLTERFATTGGGQEDIDQLRKRQQQSLGALDEQAVLKRKEMREADAAIANLQMKIVNEEKAAGGAAEDINKRIQERLKTSTQLKDLQAQSRNADAEINRLAQQRLQTRLAEYNLLKQLAQAQAQLAQSQAGAVAAEIEYQQLTGKINTKGVWEMGKKAVKEYAAEQRALQAQIEAGSKALEGNAADVVKYFESSGYFAGKSQEEIDKIVASLSDEKNRAAAIKQIQAEITDASSRQKKIESEKVDVMLRQIEVWERKKSLASLDTQYAEQMIGLMDNFAVGLGASVQMRQQAIGLMKEQQQLTENQIAQVQQQIEQGDRSDKTLERLKQLELERLGIITKQYEMTRALRDGWVSAISAMHTGSGRISKIIIDQNQNLGMGLQYLKGMATTYKSGSTKGGYSSSEQFQAGPNGLKIKNAKSDAPYQPTYGPDNATMNEAAQRAQRGDFRGALNQASGAVQARSDQIAKGGMTSMAAGSMGAGAGAAYWSGNKGGVRSIGGGGGAGGRGGPAGGMTGGSPAGGAGGGGGQSAVDRIADDVSAILSLMRGGTSVAPSSTTPVAGGTTTTNAPSSTNPAPATGGGASGTVSTAGMAATKPSATERGKAQVPDGQFGPNATVQDSGLGLKAVTYDQQKVQRQGEYKSVPLLRGGRGGPAPRGGGKPAPVSGNSFKIPDNIKNPNDRAKYIADAYNKGLITNIPDEFKKRMVFTENGVEVMSRDNLLPQEAREAGKDVQGVGKGYDQKSFRSALRDSEWNEDTTYKVRGKVSEADMGSISIGKMNGFKPAEWNKDPEFNVRTGTDEEGKDTFKTMKQSEIFAEAKKRREEQQEAYYAAHPEARAKDQQKEKEKLKAAFDAEKKASVARNAKATSKPSATERAAAAAGAGQKRKDVSTHEMSDAMVAERINAAKTPEAREQLRASLSPEAQARFDRVAAGMSGTASHTASRGQPAAPAGGAAPMTTTTTSGGQATVTLTFNITADSKDSLVKQIGKYVGEQWDKIFKGRIPNQT